MGRPRKYATKEEAAEAKKKNDKERYEKICEELKNNPQLKELISAQRAEQRANRTEEEKQREREYNTPYQKRRRAMLKQFQIKVSSEQSAEIGIQKNTSAGESKKKVHSTVEHPV